MIRKFFGNDQEWEIILDTPTTLAPDGSSPSPLREVDPIIGGIAGLRELYSPPPSSIRLQEGEGDRDSYIIRDDDDFS